MPTYMWALEGWKDSGADLVVRRYDLDASLWVTTGFANVPSAAGAASASASATFKNQGGWDGTYWYIIGIDGKLYRYLPGTDTWSSALNGGTAIITGTVEDTNWCMTSDGRYIYIMDSTSGFRKYDPAADTLTSLAAPGGSYSNQMYLVYDGGDLIYGSPGTAGLLSKWSISGGAWTALTASSAISTDTLTSAFAVYLQGYLWVCYWSSASNLYKVQRYDPSGNSWTAKATHAGYGNETNHIMGAEKTDGQIQLWISNFNSAIYDIAGDSWSAAATEAVINKQGFNWAVTRTFAGSYTWYEADGTTLMATTEDLSAIPVGTTQTFHYKVKTLSAHVLGATVSVPSMADTDAENAVTICETAGGSYSTSFNHSAALAANDVIDVYVKVAPTAGQTTGLVKQFNLRIVAN